MVGLATYTADERFQAVQMNRSEDWMLQIKRTQPTDAGDYECQINVHRSSPTLCASPGSLFISSGSSINVSCPIEHSLEPPMFVFWYHNDRMINYDAAEGGPGHISGGKPSQDAFVSGLFIRSARTQDLGNYTCGPSNADSTSVVVHALNGRKRAAMHHDLSPSGALLRVTLDSSLVLCAVLTTLGAASRITSS
ncbi:conserved hypothetical protein [Ixodes scapularis]|uniref:Ig-like domain-containing protein n=1 Tax=Ixodes scapularis TaxID=6945 RepID=B7PBK2_IXOSC|nr:conserved hypothetical protein [Ixodes scapularis]|eukprot:XP_002408331.1 conserved hypothetical protein [Ixodes scapularis]